MKHFVFDSIPEIAEYSARIATGPNIAISGGSTYGTLFNYWSKFKKLSNCNFYPVDERVIPFEDTECNWKMATEKLFRPLGIEQQRSHWAENLKNYGNLLNQKVGEPPVFDQIFLGMGTDGHTASLFPGGSELEDNKSTLVQTYSPKPPLQRISLGLNVLWNCKELILIVTGKEKSSMIPKLFQNDQTLPISLALKGHRNPLILLDKEAGSELYLPNQK